MSGITGPGDKSRQIAPISGGGKKITLPKKAANEILKQLDTIAGDVSNDCINYLLEANKSKPTRLTLAFIVDKTRVAVYKEIDLPESPLCHLKQADKIKIDLIIECLSKSLLEQYLDHYRPTQSFRELWRSEIEKILSETEIPAMRTRTAKPKRGKARGKLSRFREKAGLSRPGVDYIQIKKMEIPERIKKRIAGQIAFLSNEVFKELNASDIEEVEENVLYKITKSYLYEEINSCNPNLLFMEYCTKAGKDKLAKCMADCVRDMLNLKKTVNSNPAIRRRFRTQAEFGEYVSEKFAEIHMHYLLEADKLLSNIQIKTRVPATGSKLRRAKAIRAGVDFEKLFKTKRAGKTIKVKVPPKVPKAPKI